MNRQIIIERCFGAALLILFATACLAQESFPQAATETGANLPALSIGPNDLIAVTVYGSPELTRTVRVSDSGLIRLPMLGQKIEARGRMPAELETLISAALKEEQILIDPVVTVTIAEYHSRPISVAGAVRFPLTFQAFGKTTLLEALTRAQGLTSDAGTEILVTYPASAGIASAIKHVKVQGLIDSADPTLNVILEGGEEVRVPQVGRVFVAGNVKKPGAFRIEDGFGMTVLKALAEAEGLMPFSSKGAFIYRTGSGGSEEVPVDLRKILDRKAPDVPLASNDIFYVPDNRKARLTVEAIERTLGFAATTGSGLLIYSHP